MLTCLSYVDKWTTWNNYSDNYHFSISFILHSFFSNITSNNSALIPYGECVHYTLFCVPVIECLCAESLSCIWVCDPTEAACQAPLSMAFSRQEYWSGSPRPSPRDLPDPGVEPAFLKSPALSGGFFTTRPPGKPLVLDTTPVTSVTFSESLNFSNLQFPQVKNEEIVVDFSSISLFWHLH